MDNQVILYQPNDTVKVSVRLEGGSVWLTQAQIAQLFGVGQAAISKHIQNIYACGELDRDGSCSILEYREGFARHDVKIYNLDMILSVGYRVNSVNATLFRKWATHVLRGYVLGRNDEVRRIESLESRVGAIEVQLAEERPPKEKIFYQGFDYKQACVRAHKRSCRRGGLGRAAEIMTKTVKMFKGTVPTDDYGWARAMSDSERIAYATKLTQELWCMAYGESFPRMNRAIVLLQR